MTDARIFVRGLSYFAGSPELQAALEEVYETPERPRCLCVPGGVDMYIARHGQFVVKRMPGTGQQHHPACVSFEPEPGASGLGELLGEAIVEHPEGAIELRTDFALARRPKGAPVPRGEAQAQPPSVKAPRKLMSLRALLHYLYGKAEFNRWYPAMEGKRSQGVIARYLMEAARGVMLKGDQLDRRLYVPETFRVSEKDEIGQRRRERLSVLMSPQDGGQLRMAILVGEFMAVEQGSSGRTVRVKHMPDVPLAIDTKVWEKVERAYGDVLQAQAADVPCRPRVLMAALIYAKREHLYQIDTLTLMLVSDQWIPLDGLHELALIELLQREGRSFVKPLRYDAKAGTVFPAALLLDSGASPIPLSVVSPFMPEKEQAARRAAAVAGDSAGWVWETDKPMPPLPVRAGPGGVRPPVPDQGVGT